MQNGKINKIWKLLETVPDPEIPVISVIDLGVIRDITVKNNYYCLLYTSPSPRDRTRSRMPSSA